MTAIEITHHYDDVLQQILAEVKGLREDLKPRTTTVYNVGGSSPQAVIQRLEEHGRWNHEAVAREGRATAKARRAAISAAVTYRDTSVSSAVLRLIDGLLAEYGLPFADRSDERDPRLGREEVGVADGLSDGVVPKLGRVKVEDTGSAFARYIAHHCPNCRHDVADDPVDRNAGVDVSVDPEVHESSPSSGCGDTTVGDAGGPGSRIGEPGPHRKVLDEYMRVFDAEPRDYSPGLELPLDERAACAFGIGRHEYNRYAAGLAAALDIPHGSASAVLDGLALVAGGAQ